jgi:dTDP-4-amino-4,6-dideoxygalactose transaminase
VIPYGRQSIDAGDIAAVAAVLESDWLTQGPRVEEFEEALAAATGARFAVAFASGTAALHGTTAAAGLGPGDLVATSPLSFVASANCARYVGATPAFVDIDAATLNLDPSRLPPQADAIVAVHYAGLPVDLAALPRRPRVVIEDAAQALGATTPDGPVGNCARSDMCTFSFHPVKTITTGEGGAVTTNSPELAAALRAFRTHGIERGEGPTWRYDVATLGFNYRLTDMQAALGTHQLTKMPALVERRAWLAERYRKVLADEPIGLPPVAAEGYTSAHHLFPILVEDRDRVFDQLRRAGIGVQVHFIPIYRHSAMRDLGIDPGDFPNTEAAFARVLSIPLFPDLTEGEQDTVVAALRKVL